MTTNKIQLHQQFSRKISKTNSYAFKAWAGQNNKTIDHVAVFTKVSYKKLTLMATLTKERANTTLNNDNI